MRLGVIAIVLLLSGCGRNDNPQPVAGSGTPAPAQSQFPVTAQAESTPEPALPPPEVETQNQPAEEPSPSIPSAKFQAYTEAYSAVMQAPPPQLTRGTDGIVDPSSINASLNDLGARVQRLKAEKDALEQTLTPTEKGQWKAYQRSLSSEGE